MLYEYEIYALHMRDAQIPCKDGWADFEQEPLLDILYASSEMAAVERAALNENCSEDELYAERHTASASVGQTRIEAASFIEDNEPGIEITVMRKGKPDRKFRIIAREEGYEDFKG